MLWLHSDITDVRSSEIRFAMGHNLLNCDFDWINQDTPSKRRPTLIVFFFPLDKANPADDNKTNIIVIKPIMALYLFMENQYLPVILKFHF